MQRESRNHNISLSLPQELIAELHVFAQKRGISRFVEEAIIEKLESKKSSREQQYMNAARDQERNREFADWDTLAGDGLDEQNSW
jgi:metal-responsive CopG/Arc/MetJ family transcriptional regulator